MKTLKFELIIAGVALFGLGAFFATRPPVAEAAQTVTLDEFTASDFAIFDRDFSIRGQACEVGLQRQNLCFGRSPIESQIMPGAVLSTDVPMIGAEFRIIVATEHKDERLRTIRFGHAIALIDPETRTVRDVLHLSAGRYEDARRPPLD